MRKHISFAILGGVLLLAVVAVIAITYPQVAASSSIPFIAGPNGQIDTIHPDNPLGTVDEQIPLQQISTATYVWSYSIKFVCGFQGPFTAAGEPVVKPGNYATEINIHNNNFRPALVKKFVIVLVEQGNPIGREPNPQSSRASVTVTIPSNAAMMDDCNAIWTLINPAGAPPPNPMPLMIGYLVVVDPLDLAIDAVYTAEVPGTQSTPTGISIDVERVSGKRVYAPAGTYP